MKKIISLLCVLLILMVGALTALYTGQPQWFEGVADKLPLPRTVRTDETFAYKQSEGELTRIISARFPLEEEQTPDDLINLYEQKDRGFDLARADISLRKPAYDAAKSMFAAAVADGVEGFILTSGYRTRARQQELYDSDGDKGTVNRPGESEHEYGLTFDVTAYSNGDFDETEQFAWLSAHSWEHGFILRYPADKEALTGVPYESWHYRYVGKEAARVMHEENWCLEEYAAFR